MAGRKIFGDVRLMIWHISVFIGVAAGGAVAADSAAHPGLRPAPGSLETDGTTTTEQLGSADRPPANGVGKGADRTVSIRFLDTRNQLIADEAQARGTVNHTPVYSREVVQRAFEQHTMALILVHNHPSGDPSPSREDVEMTREVAVAR